MAEINVAAAKPRPGVRRSKKSSTRVDLTPMVDLGFLLITFFIFTTTISEPAALKIFMPAGEKDDTVVPESGALTVIPASDRKLFYYHGRLEDALQTGTFGYTDYSITNGLGKIIREKQQALDRIKVNGRKDLMLIIKPIDHSNVQSFVRVLDEVAINAVGHYAIVDMKGEERSYLEMKNIRF